MTARKKATKSVRLSPHIEPLRYKIYLEPDLESFTFVGTEEIEIKISESTKLIKLHAAELQISEVSVMQGKVSQNASIKFLEKEEEVDFVFKSPLKEGKATLKISFTGILNDKMRGFYRSKYTHEGKEYHMGVTQFESTDARRAFPCFDEPSQKAVFEVTLKIPEDRTAISNMLEEEVTEHKDGYKIIRFSESPRMSSYLLAFIIGHFEFIEDKTRDGVVVRVFVTPGKKNQAEFALSVAVKTLEFYTDYFKIKYPLPSMDLVAIPDFAAGAMENWGAVTYRETALLVDPENSSTHNKQWVALVIAHELAHQWFGNLVTMEWWTHLWLNEGFASYMEYVAVNHMFPEWNIWTQFVYMDHARALELDGLKNTHAIEVEVNHPAEISEIFDEVSYSKGASVIRMLAEYLGYYQFRDGLRFYLKKHSYKNAETGELWEALEHASKKDVASIMKNWTGEPGYPLLNVEKKGSVVTISQKKFFSSIFSQKTIDTTQWMVPVSVMSNSGNQEFLLDRKSQKINVPHGWVKLNKDETSFARVKYDENLLQLLKTPIEKKSEALSEQDRFGIIRDAFVLSEAEFLSADQALNLVTSYKNNTSYISWAEIASDMGKIKNLLFGEKIYNDFENFIVELFTKIGDTVGWEKKKNEDHSITLLRSIVLGVLARNKDKKTVEKALDLFKKDKAGSIKLDSDLRSMVYVVAAENGSEKEYTYFMKRYKEEVFQEEKDRILRALCAFKDKVILQKVLDFAFTDQVKAQDSFKVVTFIAGNPHGRDLAWKKVKKEWGSIEKKFGGGHLFTRFVKPFAVFTNTIDAKALETFFKKQNSQGLDRTIQQVLEQIKSNAEWKKRDLKKIEKFLKTR